MKRMHSVCLAIAFVAASVQNLWADTIPINTLFNTGVNSSVAVLPNATIGDPHYSLFSVPTGSTKDLRIITSAGGFPIPPYIADNTTSRWIVPNNPPTGINAGDNSPPGTYIFRTTFDLTGLRPLTASIKGGWSSDNNGLGIYLNGVNTLAPATSPTQFSQGFKAFTITAGFVSGVNTLDFYINNASGATGNPVALRVEMTGTADEVPAPPAMVLLSGLVGMGVLRGWRRRRCVA